MELARRCFAEGGEELACRTVPVAFGAPALHSIYFSRPVEPVLPNLQAEAETKQWPGDYRLE